MTPSPTPSISCRMVAEFDDDASAFASAEPEFISPPAATGFPPGQFPGGCCLACVPPTYCGRGGRREKVLAQDPPPLHRTRAGKEGPSASGACGRAGQGVHPRRVRRTSGGTGPSRGRTPNLFGGRGGGGGQVLPRSLRPPRARPARGRSSHPPADRGILDPRPLDGHPQHPLRGRARRAADGAGLTHPTRRGRTRSAFNTGTATCRRRRPRGRRSPGRRRPSDRRCSRNSGGRRRSRRTGRKRLAGPG
jgi:hypothetical protein